MFTLISCSHLQTNLGVVQAIGWFPPIPIMRFSCRSLGPNRDFEDHKGGWQGHHYLGIPLEKMASDDVSLEQLSGKSRTPLLYRHFPHTEWPFGEQSLGNDTAYSFCSPSCAAQEDGRKIPGSRQDSVKSDVVNRGSLTINHQTGWAPRFLKHTPKKNEATKKSIASCPLLHLAITSVTTGGSIAHIQ